jgi:hypothetical protein
MGLNARQGAYRTLATLESEGFLACAEVMIFKRMSQKIFGVTAHGLAHAFEVDEPMERRPVFEPSKVKLSTLNHELDIQRLRLRAEGAGWRNWIPGSRLGISLPGMKRPDAVSLDPQGLWVAIEVERTIKTTKRYEVLLSQYLQLVAKGKFSRVLWLCPTADLALRLNKILGSINAVPVAGKRIELEERHARLWSVRDYQTGLIAHIKEETT